MFNLIQTTVMPKVKVEHAGKEFLCFLKLFKGVNSLSKEWRQVDWKKGAFGHVMCQILLLKSWSRRAVDHCGNPAVVEALAFQLSLSVQEEGMRYKQIP